MSFTETRERLIELIIERALKYCDDPYFYLYLRLS